MSSNYNNFFLTLVDERPSFDEFVYGPNYATASTIFTGSEETWFPTPNSTTSQGQIRKYETYVFSPIHFGHLIDMFKSPPERLFAPSVIQSNDLSPRKKSKKIKKPPVAPITVKMTGSYTVEIDKHSRIFTRFHEQDNVDIVTGSLFTELTF